MNNKECPRCPLNLGDWKEGEYFDRCNNCGYEEDKRQPIPLYAPGFGSEKEYDLETIDRFGSFRVFISDKDIQSTEPPHVHIKRKHGSRDHAKIWLETLKFEYCFGFKVQEKKDIKNTVEEKQQEYLRKWYELKRQAGR